MKRNHDDIGSFSGLNELISACWGANVQTRAEDLEQETDFSYIHIIKPWILERIAQCAALESRILDTGCGCGYLTNAIRESGFPHIRGVDLSAASIEYARRRYPAIPFDCADICRYHSAERYDICLSVMMLNNLPDLDAFFSAARTFLADAGRVMIAIPHPCYWPQRHLIAQNYAYFQEKPYEYTFSTKGRTDYASPILYFHRTLETYFRSIQRHGFQIAAFQEFHETSEQTAPDILGIELTFP